MINLSVFPTVINRLEILLSVKIIKSIVKYLIKGINLPLHTWLKKNNYREYIIKIKYESKALKKVLLRHLTLKGSVNLIIQLVCRFFNLVNFLMINISSTSSLKFVYIVIIRKINQVCVFVYYGYFSAIYKFQR